MLLIATAANAYPLADGVAPQNGAPISPITTITTTNTDGSGAREAGAARRLLGSGEGESCDGIKHCASGFTCLSNTKCARKAHIGEECGAARGGLECSPSDHVVCVDIRNLCRAGCTLSTCGCKPENNGLKGVCWDCSNTDDAKIASAESVKWECANGQAIGETAHSTLASTDTGINGINAEVPVL